MKRIIFIRHAKTENKAAGMTDLDRQLTAEGSSTAHELGHELDRHGIRADKIITSHAKRAMQTAEAIAKSLGFDPKQIVKDEVLYQASNEDYKNLIWSQDEGLETLIIIGHNPGISAIVTLLSHHPVEHMASGSMVVLEFQSAKWDDVNRQSGKLLLKE